MTISSPFSSCQQTSSGIMRSREFWLFLAGVVLWAVISRLLLNAHTYFDAEDSLMYAVNIRARDFVRFDTAGSGWQLICTAVDALLPASSEATVAGKLVARVTGSLLLPLLYITLVIKTGRIALSAALTLFFSGAFCPWWYSLQPDKYVPQLGVIAIALSLVVTRQRPPSVGFLITLGLVYFVAIIVHTDSGLVCLSILPLLWSTLRRRGIGRAVGQGLLTAGVMFIALFSYYSMFLLLFIKPASPARALDWVMSYMSIPQATRDWGHWTLEAPLLAFVGIGRSVFTTEFVFASPTIARFLATQFPDKILVEEVWLANHMAAGLPEIGLGLLALAVLAVCAVLIAGVVAVRGMLRDKRDHDWHAIASVLCYLVPAAIFFDWWEPINNEFWIAPWYAVVLLLGIVIGGMDWRFMAPFVAASAAILIACNGLLGVYPRLDAKSDYWLMRQAPIAEVAGRGDLIVENGFLAGNYLEFLSAARVFRADANAQDQSMLKRAFHADLDLISATKSVYLTDLVTQAIEQSSLLRSVSPADDTIQRFFGSLPPPDEWITVNDHRLARYDAFHLKAYLSE